MMDYPCGKFGDRSLSRFGSIVGTDTRTDRCRWTLYSRDSVSPDSMVLYKCFIIIIIIIIIIKDIIISLSPPAKQTIMYQLALKQPNSVHSKR